jgi:hypothetical protein
MDQKELSELSDEELLQMDKKRRSSAIFYAFFIGFLVGIIIFSVVVSAWGVSILIPLFLIYKLTKNPDIKGKELDEVLKSRGLK